jgi:phage shock protein A
MGLFERIGDVLSANLNDLVEKFEDPERMLRQAIREMESAVELARQETARAMADARMVHRSLAEHQAQARDWQGRAEQAVLAGDDDRARRALARQREYDKLVAALNDQAAAADEASQTLRRQLEAMQARLAEARRRLVTHGTRKRAAQVRSRVECALSSGPPDPSAFEQFERLRKKVERLEAEAEALRELDAGPEGVPAPPVEAPPRAGVTEAELAALKERLGK